MTVVLMGASALLAAAGSRWAAAGFVAAAATGAMTEGHAAAATWTAALAAGLVMVVGSPRRVAVPAVGAAATLIAASASNGATVLSAWVLASAAVLAAWPVGAEGRRSAVLLAGADLLVVGAMVQTVANGDLAGWTAHLDAVGGTLLLGAALARIPAVVGPPEVPEAGGLVVRAQVAVLAALAVASVPRGVAVATALAAAAVFVLGGTSTDGATRDGIQEAGLVVLAISAGALGWTPGAWVWGALAAGTLTRYLRLSLRGSQPLNAQVRAILDGGGIALPLLPVAAALASGAAGQRGPEGLVVVLALGAGLGARARLPSRAGARWSRSPPSPWTGRLRVAAIGLAVVAGLWAPALTLPRPPAPAPGPWPPLWAAVLVGIAGVAGAILLPSLAPSREPPRAAPGGMKVPQVTLDPPRTIPLALVGAEAVVAAGLWGLGWLRGFL